MHFKHTVSNLDIGEFTEIDLKSDVSLKDLNQWRSYNVFQEAKDSTRCLQ